MKNNEIINDFRCSVTALREVKQSVFRFATKVINEVTTYLADGDTIDTMSDENVALYDNNANLIIQLYHHQGDLYYLTDNSFSDDIRTLEGDEYIEVIFFLCNWLKEQED